MSSLAFLSAMLLFLRMGSFRAYGSHTREACRCSMCKLPTYVVAASLPTQASSPWMLRAPGSSTGSCTGGWGGHQHTMRIVALASQTCNKIQQLAIRYSRVQAGRGRLLRYIWLVADCRCTWAAGCCSLELLGQPLPAEPNRTSIVQFLASCQVREGLYSCAWGPGGAKALRSISALLPGWARPGSCWLLCAWRGRTAGAAQALLAFTPHLAGLATHA